MTCIGPGLLSKNSKLRRHIRMANSGGWLGTGTWLAGKDRLTTQCPEIAAEPRTVSRAVNNGSNWHQSDKHAVVVASRDGIESDQLMFH